MSSNSQYAQGLVLVNGHAYLAKDVLQALERQAMTSLRVVGNELWIGKERVRPLTKTSPEQAMKLTCYGSLAFCCSLSRECHLRDEALRLLGITKEEYRITQEECHHQFLRFSERRWPQESSMAPSTEYSRAGSYTGSKSHLETQEVRRESGSSRSYGSSWDSLQPSASRSSSTVELGGLFDTPKEYNSRSFTNPDPFSGRSTRFAGEATSFEPDKLGAGGSATMAVTPSHSQGFCIYCGQDLREDSEFCSRCGRSQK